MPMEKRELNTRANINFLVRTFYSKVRQDDLIGPIFNAQVDDWEAHFERLTDFWEANLLWAPTYRGNPVKVHVQVDQTHEEDITPVHFGRWIQLWFGTLNEHFTGEMAELAKGRARNMSTHLFMKMFAARKA